MQELKLTKFSVITSVSMSGAILGYELQRNGSELPITINAAWRWNTIEALRTHLEEARRDCHISPTVADDIAAAIDNHLAASEEAGKPSLRAQLLAKLAEASLIAFEIEDGNRSTQSSSVCEAIEIARNAAREEEAAAQARADALASDLARNNAEIRDAAKEGGSL